MNSKIILSTMLLSAIFSTTIFAQWSTSGNSVSSTNFLGTTNNVSLKIKTNSLASGFTESLRLLPKLAGATYAGSVIINPEGQSDADLQAAGGGLIINNRSLNFINTTSNLWQNQIVFYGPNSMWAGARIIIVDEGGTGGLRILTGMAGSLDVTKFDNRVSIGNAGMATPVGYSLYVAKGILTEKIKVSLQNTSDWADYVFSPNYKLKTLQQVEAYIKINKHLPDMPSAQDVVKNGLDLVKSDAMLLAKIEELTLYLIEMQKKNDEMQKKIDAIIINKP